MRRWLAILLFAGSSVFVLGDVPVEPDAPELRHNPFDRPDFVAKLTHGAEGAQLSGWPYVLHATLRAGALSLANVDGRLIGVGEEYEGYRLIRVGEGDATFQKDGLRVTVTVGNKDEESDDT